MMLGAFLIAIGIFSLAIAFGILPASIATLVWPLLAIFVGVWLLLDKRHGKSCTCLGCSGLKPKRSAKRK